ncbi:MAG TPA: hypothetical protein VIC57_08130 [Candidatus Dormibacteraeota bacterium]|jgi:hypothetical protein
MNAELRGIFEADQADRRSDLGPEVASRDRERRRRVLELLAAGEVVDGADHYHAAMVFQHGGSRESYRRARELALRAAELGHRSGRWLAAAALDRLLVHEGRPQRFGTQYRARDGEWLLVEVDPATTDEERAAWDVPPLGEALARAKGVTPPDGAPVLAGDVEVRIHRSGPAVRVENRAVPAAPGEPPAGVRGPLPWLPDGVQVAPAGDGVAAIAPSGWSVTWVSRPMSEEESVLIGWHDEDGEPRVEVVDVAGAPAALIEGEAADRRWLIRPTGGGRGWMLVGRLPMEDLLRVAATLPAAE